MTRHFLLCLLLLSPLSFSAVQWHSPWGAPGATYGSAQAACDASGNPDVSAVYAGLYTFGCALPGGGWIGTVTRTGECDPGTTYNSSNGSCNGTPEDCIGAAASQGYNAVYTQDESGATCSIGPDVGREDCGVVVGTGCYSNEPGPDRNCGTVNGEIVCVTSVEGQGVGTSTETPQSTSSTSEPSTETTVETDPANGTTTTTTTTRTTTTTTTTTANTGGSGGVPSGAEVGEGAGTNAPYTCQDGRLASGPISCDSAQTCPPDFYLDYGVCIPLPTYTTTTETTESTTTRTTRVDATGEESTVISNTTSVTPQPTNTGGNSINVEIPGLDGPCDPSEPDYFECNAVESVLPDHTQVNPDGVGDTSLDFYGRVANAPVVQAFGAIADLVPSGTGQCPPISVDLSATMIGQTIGTTLHCDISSELGPIISAIMIIIWLFIAARLFGTA